MEAQTADPLEGEGSAPRQPSRRHNRIWARRSKRATPQARGSHWIPPRCPNEDCSHHTEPEGLWCRKRGTYWTLGRSRPSQRFQCKGCRRTFSPASFRMDRHDNKPWLNVEVLE